MSRGSRGPLASRFCTFHNNNYCVRDKGAHDIRKSFVLYLLKQKVNHAISHNESLRCIGFQLHDFLSDLSINKKFTKPVYFNGSQFLRKQTSIVLISRNYHSIMQISKHEPSLELISKKQQTSLERNFKEKQTSLMRNPKKKQSLLIRNSKEKQTLTVLSSTAEHTFQGTSTVKQNSNMYYLRKRESYL